MGRKKNAAADSAVIVSGTLSSENEGKEGKGIEGKKKNSSSNSIKNSRKKSSVPCDSAVAVTGLKGGTKLVSEKKKKSIKTKPSPTVPYAIDVHPQRDEIIQDILDGKSRASIRKKYGLSNDSVIRNYLEKRLTQPLAAKKLEERDSSAEILQKKIDEIQSYLNKLIASCDAYLSDPHDPSRYIMSDRAEELTVVYEKKIELPDGKIIRAKETGNLQELLNIALDPEENRVLAIKSSRVDIRKLLLDTLSVSQKQIEMIGRITGQMQDILVHADIGGLVIPKLYDLIDDASYSNPEIRNRMIEGLISIAEESEGLL